MIKKTVTLKLPGGYFKAEVLEYQKSDLQILSNVYKNWRSLCIDLTNLESRSINLPEGLSEGAFCLEMRTVRIKGIQGAKSSFDCYDLRTNERIQVKGCSVIPDLTSFGPKSVWDKLYFMDFYRQGKWDGTFDIYFIDSNYIYNQMVSSTQTFKQQQSQGRRPRFSIYDSIIRPNKLNPIKMGRL